jgi:DNA recombination protein RmuC
MSQFHVVLLLLGSILVLQLLFLFTRTRRKDSNEGLAQMEGRLREDLNREGRSSREEIQRTILLFQDSLRALVQGQLDEVRQLVDEKLHHSLEQRLGESFRQVAERLAEVHKGLGEMQNLAAGVGDLKRVLTNVKIRGTWGEIQLRALLEEILTSDQYALNVKTNIHSHDLVEVAIRLPGQTQGNEDPVWLPVDSKFPIEDYQRLLEASESGDALQVASLGRKLEYSIRSSAKEIATKYLCPPQTTDFAVLFLPIEGLYCEVVKRNGLLEGLQRDYRIIIAGPSTFSALLNSLQMGFRTLAIEKRSSEVWQLLGTVRQQFVKFGGTLDKVKRSLESAHSQLEEASVRSRQIERRLKRADVHSTDMAEMLEEVVG